MYILSLAAFPLHQQELLSSYNGDLMAHKSKTVTIQALKEKFADLCLKLLCFRIIIA